MNIKTLPERLARLQRLIELKGLEGILIFKPQNVFYLSGFNPMIQSHPLAVWLPAKGEATLILHALRYQHARVEAGLNKLALFGRWGPHGHDALPDFWSTVRACLAEADLSETARLGVEESHMPIKLQRNLQALFPRVEFVGVDDLLYEQRQVKTPEEIDLVEKAAWIADQGMEAGITAIKAGATEADVSIRAMTAMQEAWNRRFPDLEPVDFGTNEGGVLNALWAYCLSGPRMNMMCDSSKSRPIEDGDLVLIVIWTALNGYHAENERTISLGPVCGEKERAFETVLKARENALKSVRPGVPASTVYQAAAEVMIQRGFGEVLPGRIGHGLGLGAHEPFSLGPDNDCPLEKDMVLSFEPALRIGEQGGVQHSDTIVITSHGFRYLTHTERGVITV